MCRGGSPFPVPTSLPSLYPPCPLERNWKRPPSLFSEEPLGQATWESPKKQGPATLASWAQLSLGPQQPCRGQRSRLTHQLTEAQTGHTAPHPSATDPGTRVPTQVCAPENSSAGVRPPAAPTQGVGASDEPLEGGEGPTGTAGAHHSTGDHWVPRVPPQGLRCAPRLGPSPHPVKPPPRPSKALPTPGADTWSRRRATRCHLLPAGKPVLNPKGQLPNETAVTLIVSKCLRLHGRPTCTALLGSPSALRPHSGPWVLGGFPCRAASPQINGARQADAGPAGRAWKVL